MVIIQSLRKISRKLILLSCSSIFKFKLRLQSVRSISHTDRQAWKQNIRIFSTASTLYRNYDNNRDVRTYDLEYNDEEIDQSDKSDNALEEKVHKEVFQEIFRIPGTGHNVFVIQPKVKFFARKNFNTTVELQLAEAVTLAETLSGWKVVEKHIIGCRNPTSKYVFNAGNFEKLKKLIKQNKAVTAVFFGINILSGVQHTELEKELCLPIFDRYSIVLQIFLDHAHSREAKLQVALAEIPYLRNRLKFIHDAHQNHSRGNMKHIGGSGETFYQSRRRILSAYEEKVKKQLETLSKRRGLLRQARKKSSIPIVSVVGYTNAGKTSLIKILTDDEKMEPKDQLFATLDVTAHATNPVGFQKIIYMDTVGFISDIPTLLINSFASTLEDIVLSDLIIHIRDFSHPDKVSQKETVLETLRSLDLSQKLMDTMLEVGNKIDLLETFPESEGAIMVSATKETGIAELRLAVEKRLMENTGNLVTTLRVPTGGEACSWLYKVAGLKGIEPDPEDNNFLLMEVVLTPGNLAKFKHHFGDLEL